MYIGVDFLMDPEKRFYVSEVNNGLPGGAQEYDFTYQVIHGKPSGVFDRIECISIGKYGKDFRTYINEMPYIDDLRAIKLWMDGHGPLPRNPHPMLRLEDKWIQFLLLSENFPMIPTKIFNPQDIDPVSMILARDGKVVLKRRLGRGGRGFIVTSNLDEITSQGLEPNFYLVQPYIESSVASYRLSIRAAAFAGSYICMYANVSERVTSNHGLLFHVSHGDRLGITDDEFQIVRFRQRAWEASIWFGDKNPGYLYHNLYEEDVASAELIIPEDIFNKIKEISASISEYYESLHFSQLPKAYFEQ